MRTLVVISRCMKNLGPIGMREWKFLFHFKGVYLGERIHSIEVSVINEAGDTGIIIGEDYLLYLNMVTADQGRLRGKVTYIKKLDELSLHF